MWRASVIVMLGLIALVWMLPIVVRPAPDPCCLKKDACKVKACECGCKND